MPRCCTVCDHESPPLASLRPAEHPPMKTAMKTATGTPTKLATKLAGPARRPQPHGGALLAGGVPGHRGGGGRPPKAFVAFCATLAGDPAFQRALEATATDPSHRHWAAVCLVVEYADGLPAQPVDITVSIDTVRARLVDRIARITRTREVG